MNNKVYYGEYSLKHWIDLIMKENIILPDYQRYFVWSESKVKTLIDTFKKKEFVPPVTIGAFKNKDTNQNFIIDGQQRLTSIFLAYLDLYPDKTSFKKGEPDLINENDDDDDDKRVLDNVFDWTFKKLVEIGKNKQTIRNNIEEGNYKIIKFKIDEKFLKTNFLGFSYLVPCVTDDKIQQKYYSSVFRNINIQGQALLPQESRASLYYLDKNLAQFFDPDFCKDIKIKNSNNETKLDFVRYLSLLSQYHKDNDLNKIARGYKPIMEEYYEKFIYSVVEDSSTNNTSVVEDSSTTNTSVVEDSSTTNTSVVKDSSTTNTSVVEDSSTTNTSVVEDSSTTNTSVVKDSSTTNTSVVEDSSAANTFSHFSDLFPDKEYNIQFDHLKEAIIELDIKNQDFSSIIELDIYFFGLIYEVVFKNKKIDFTKKIELKEKLNERIKSFKRKTSHRRAPGGLQYLRSRIYESIKIYKSYIYNE